VLPTKMHWNLTSSKQKTLIWTGIVTTVTSFAVYFCYKYFTKSRVSIPKTIVTRALNLTIDTPLEVVHKTDKILVINKPYGNKNSI
jgi:23S rRNA-/tRNA-specific pseudouridylate synthase